MFHKPSKETLVNFSKCSALGYPAKDISGATSWLNGKLSNVM